MALEKKSSLDSINILTNGVVQIRRTVSILEDGKEISSRFHRITLLPGDEVSGYPTRLKNIINAVWTPQVVANYAASVS